MVWPYDMAMSIDKVDGASLNDTPRTLSDEEIEKLLNEAENRLRVKAGLETTEQDDNVLALDADVAPSSVQRVHLPKLEHNLEKSSYLKHQNGIARTNSSLTIPTEQLKMAEGLRSIVSEQTSKKVVCSPLPSLESIHMRKIYPNYLLMHISTSF